MPAPRPIALACTASLCALLALAPPCSHGQTGRPAAAELEAENLRLARLLELAASDRFYLLLDAGRGQLRLMYRGAALREFPVLEARVGQRRALFAARPLPAGWADSVWTDGQLRPARGFERVELDPPNAPVPPESLTVIIPPTPEEAIPAPARYLIRYGNGLALEIVARDSAAADGNGGQPRASTPFGERLLYALAPWSQPKLLLRLEMPPADAGALYRSLPEESDFLLVPAKAGSS